MFQKRLQFFRSILYLGDLLLVAVSWLASLGLRYYLADSRHIPLTETLPDLNDYLLLMILVTAIFAVILPTSRLYHRPWSSARQAWWPIVRATTVGVILAVTVTYFLRPYGFSRFVFLTFFVILTTALMVYRPLLRRLWSRLKPQSLGEGVIIVGVEELGRLVAEKIALHPELGLRVDGFITSRPEMVGQVIDGIEVLGTYQQVRQEIRARDIQVVMIALPLDAHHRIEDILTHLGDEVVDIKIVPDLVRFISLSGSVEEFEGLAIIGVRGSPMQGWAQVLKRTVDVTGALAAITIFAIPMAVIAIAVKLTSPGPVFYRQQRMGLDGRVFDMLKFRSMDVDAEAECGPVWANENDPRCTRLGAFLRRTSLDELPQFFNVLKGEMSLVGPRPERPAFITDFRKKIPGYMLRHKVKAGITGWAQVNGWRGNTSLERRIECDLYYIENWSLAFDLKIILLTLFVGFRHPHAY